MQLVWKINRILWWIGRRAEQSSVVRDSAAALQQELPRPELFDFFDVLCANEYEDNTEAEGFDLPSAKRRDQQDMAIAALRAKYPQIEDQIAAIEQFLDQAVDAGIELKSVGSVLSQVCGDRAFLEGFSEYLLKHDQSLIASAAGIAVGQWRRLDATRFARYGCLFANSENVRMVGSVASAVSYGPQLNDPIHQDLEILTALAGRKEAYVLGPVFFGLKRLTKAHTFRAPALALITGVQIGDRHNLAKEYCNIFGPYGLSPALLDRSGVEKMLANLIAIEELDRDAFGGFIANVCGIAPLSIVSFFEARIAHALSLQDSGRDTDYDPIPSSFSWSTLSGVRGSSDYEAALRRMRDLMMRFPNYLYQLRSLFWRLGTTDTTTFTVLDELLHTSDPHDPTWVIDLLGEAPKGIALNHPMFAIHVLMECAGRSEELERAAMGRLIGNCFSAGGFQVMALGNGMPGGNGALSDPMQAAVAEQLTNWKPDSLAFKLFSEIANARGPSFLQPAFPDMLDDTEESDES